MCYYAKAILNVGGSFNNVNRTLFLFLVVVNGTLNYKGATLCDGGGGG